MTVFVASKNMPPLPDSFGKIFWKNQFQTKIELPTERKFSSLQGKVAIVTGANCGLGFESASQLLALGLSRLVIAVRSMEKGKAAALKLGRVSPTSTIDVWALDMESYDSIQAFVRKCNTDLSRIDYIILNAGIGPIIFSASSSTGHESAIQINFLSTALLAMLLLPLLKTKSTRDNPARMTVVNTVSAHTAKFPNRDRRPLLPSFDDPEITPWDPRERYGVSKLLAQLFFVKLTEYINSDDVVINMVDPGATKGTYLAREASGIMLIAVKSLLLIAGRPVERGAATYVDALLGHGKESHGCFLMNCEISPLASIYYTADGKNVTKQIWEETMKELSFAYVEDIVASMN